MLREVANQVEASLYVLDVSVGVEYGTNVYHLLKDAKPRVVHTGRDTVSITITHQSRMPSEGAINGV